MNNMKLAERSLRRNHPRRENGIYSNDPGLLPTNTLSPGGRVVYRLTHRAPATCETIALLAGIGPQEIR